MIMGEISLLSLVKYLEEDKLSRGEDESARFPSDIQFFIHPFPALYSRNSSYPVLFALSQPRIQFDFER